jgi:serine/threonine protein kinase
MADRRVSVRPAPVGLNPGTVVGRYVIVQTLGRGGMGAVMLAYDTHLARKVAIKMLLTNISSEEARVRMLREAQAMAQLSHPNVVAIYDAGTHEENVYLAMEYVDGTTLGDWLDKPRSRRHVLAVMRQAGRGLAAAHAAGIVHRDFKPENVLIAKDGQARVLDFGIASTAGASPAPATGFSSEASAPPHLPHGSGPVPRDRITEEGAILGTIGYFAPETIERTADARSDVFSFCVTLWQALFGDLPFAAASLNEYLRATTKEPPPCPKATADVTWLYGIVRKGLDPDPARRYASIAELLAAIDAADPDRPRTPRTGGTRGDDVVAFELTFRSNFELVSIVRHFVSEFYDKILGNAEVTSRIALATHELLENAVKYSASKETELLVQVDRGTEPATITVRTWNDASEDDFTAVERTFAAMSERGDASAFYQEQIEASLEREGSGLGLARIGAEADMTLSCEREGNRVCIVARTRASTA